MKKLLTLILVLCTLAAFAEMRGGALYDPGAARSNLSNITSGSTLAVANGGTGATTAAAGLAALGGASLNGSSTVDFLARKITVGATTKKIISGTEYFAMPPDSVVVSSIIGSDAITGIIGRVFIHDGYYTNGAIIDIYGKDPAITGQTSALYSTIKDNASTINVYYEGTEIKIQNKRAVTVLVTFGFTGLR